ncbi:hypothetical protein HYPSUDRAFT_62541 [Hypholoma sublateritium FD-334 SS-4]|uniref:SAM domain-containing protein n=1 Tax=Hypholoma sublateritium (strain FD-334 SS-4) TaxID=945553 RepID=A0A0D2PB99_HYPSF|nr:hypothetical protein HYPSUDRAFT_62541 [Hypholoma sublateritium FD-334 SS-4]
MDLKKHILDWDETDVHQWLSSLGFAHYERQIKEHRIQGDSLCLVDTEGLRNIGVSSMGQRLSILKGIYEVKIAHNVEFGEDDYIPPSEAKEATSLEHLHSSVMDQAQRLRSLEENNRTINNAMRAFLDEITKLRLSMGLPAEEKIRKKIPYLRSDIEAIGRAALGSTQVTARQGNSSPPPTSQSISTAYSTPRSGSHDTSDTAKVSLDDPTWKVLPAALKKHRINTEEWPDYEMFITFGPQANRTKRLLQRDEKPLYLFKKLKDAKKNPAFVLKNMKDLRSSANDNHNNSSRESLPDTAQSFSRAYPTPNSSTIS